MRVTTILELLSLLFFSSTGNSATDLEEVTEYVNRNLKIDINVFLNLNHKENPAVVNEHFEKTIKNLKHMPKLIETEVTNVKSLKGSFSERSLTLAWLTLDNVNTTFNAIDKLLKGLHFTDIIIVYHKPRKLNEELLYISQWCWKYGFTSVLIWTEQQLFTYHPYPTIKIRALQNVSQFDDKSHLQNFQKFKMYQPTVNFPPIFYNYTNRQGQIMYAGYVYRLISLFLTHHNASLSYFFFDMWSNNVTMDDVQAVCKLQGCAFLPVLVGYEDHFMQSNSPFLSEVVLIVPSPQEISESLYLIIPFDGLVWSLLLVAGLLYFSLMHIVACREKTNQDFSLNFLNAFRIIMFLPVAGINGRTFKYFFLNLLVLFTGIFLTNYYSTSLWSLYTSKVYEPELLELTDIGRTNLKIFVYSIDVRYYRSLDFPAIISERLHVGSETELAVYRQNLNMTYIYVAHDYLADYILLQQNYLKRPFAKRLPEAFYYRPFIISMLLNTPYYQQFNRYLSRIFASGIFNKFLNDISGDGMTNGNLRPFRDSEETTEALSMEYFYYIFVILVVGLAAAFLVFLMEYFYSRKIQQK